MFGLLFGTACLAGLYFVVRGGRGRSPGSRHHGGHRGFRSAPDFLLRHLFVELDTTPGQEKVIAEAVRKAAEGLRGLKLQLDQSRKDIAAALRQPELDRAAIDGAVSGHGAALDALREDLSSSLFEIHGVLDEGQRGRLADLIERAGTWRAFWHRRHRGHGCDGARSESCVPDSSTCHGHHHAC